MNTGDVSVGTSRYLDLSAKVDESGLDWDLAKKIGITDNEKFVITYFADIEGQTIVYLRDLLKTRAALEPDVVAFLSMWNYEEYFHGRLLTQFLTVCGHSLEADRIQKVRKSAKFSEVVESFLAGCISKAFEKDFPAVYMAWGAVQELTTLKGYEELSKTTKNPVFKIICERIAKQERRHFAWYYNNARARLDQSERARKLTHTLLKKFWSPVGAGVKTPQEVSTLFSFLFTPERKVEVSKLVDQKISSLPGLNGLEIMSHYLKSQKMITVA